MDWGIKYEAITSLAKVVSVAPKQTANIFEQLSSHLFTLGWKNEATAKAFAKIVEKNPNTIYEALTILELLLENKNFDVSHEVALILCSIIWSSPTIAPPITLPLLKTLVIYDGWRSTGQACLSFKAIVSANQDFTAVILEWIELLIAQEDFRAKIAAAEAIVEVVSGAEGTAEYALSLLATFFSNYNSKVAVDDRALESLMDQIAQSFGNVVKAVPKSSVTAIKLLTDLSNGSVYDKWVVAGSLGKIVMNAPEQADNVLSILTPLFARDDASIRKSAVLSFRYVIRTEYKTSSQSLEYIPALLEDQDWGVRLQAIHLLVEVIGANFNDFNILGFLSPLLEDKDSIVRESAEEAVGIVVNSNPHLADNAFKLLTALLTDEKKSHPKAILSLAEVVNILPTKAHEVLTILLKFSSHWSSDVRSAVSTSLGKVTTSLPSVANDTIQILSSLLIDQRIYMVKVSALKALAEIVISAPEESDRAIQLLTPLFKDAEKYVREAAADSLTKIVVVSSKNAEVALTLLSPLLSDVEGDVRLAAAKSIGKIVKVNPGTAYIVFDLLNLVSEDKILYVRKEVIDAINEAAKVVDISHASFFDLLEHNNFHIRNAAINLIPEKLTKLEDDLGLNASDDVLEDQLSGTDKIHINPSLIETLLSIIGNESKYAEENVKKTSKAAKSTLNQITNNIDEQTLKIIIEWIYDGFPESNFDILLSFSSYTPIFYKILYHKVLKNINNLNDEVVITVAKGFVINCIKEGFTSTFTDKGEIIFEEVTYRFNENNKTFFEEIIRIALVQKNILSKQYRDHEPLFPNSGSALPIAGSDIKIVPSLVVQSERLGDVFNWNLSLLSHIEDPKREFIILERRNEFGHLGVIKITNEGISDEESFHPEKITKEILAKIFGNIENKKFEVFSWTVCLLKNDLLEQINKAMKSSLASAVASCASAIDDFALETAHPKAPLNLRDVVQKILADAPNSHQRIEEIEGWRLLGYEDHSPQAISAKIRDIEYVFNNISSYTLTNEQISSLKTQVEATGRIYTEDNWNTIIDSIRNLEISSGLTQDLYEILSEKITHIKKNIDAERAVHTTSANASAATMEHAYTTANQPLHTDIL